MDEKIEEKNEEEELEDVESEESDEEENEENGDKYEAPEIVLPQLEIPNNIISHFKIQRSNSPHSASSESFDEEDFQLNENETPTNLEPVDKIVSEIPCEEKIVEDAEDFEEFLNEVPKESKSEDYTDVPEVNQFTTMTEPELLKFRERCLESYILNSNSNHEEKANCAMVKMRQVCNHEDTSENKLLM